MSTAAQMDFYRRVHTPWLGDADGEDGERHVVLGYALQPLTLWHVREVEWAQLCVGAHWMDGLTGLLACVEVCSRRPFEQPRRGLLARMARLYRRRRAVALWARYEEEQLIRWGGYLGEYGHTAGPLLLPGGDRKSRPVKCPGWLYMVAVLMRKGHMSAREAWSTQLRQAKWYLEALHEAEGGEATSLLSAGDVEAMPDEVWQEIEGMDG